MRVENIFYRLWSKGFYNSIRTQYETLDKDYLYLDDYLPYVKIDENDKVFLKELHYRLYVEAKMAKLEEVDQKDTVDWFLRGLFSNYVKKFDDGKEKKHQTDWLNHTRELTKEEYPTIYKWCNEYQAEFID